MEDFLRILKEALNMNPGDSVESGTVLAELDGWDSLGKFMFVSSIFSDLGVILEPDGINKARSVGELWELVKTSK